MARGGRSGKYAWRDAPEYQLDESNPNPKFRPSIDRLITKLRRLKAFENKPEAVEFVVHDLIYWYFYREAKRPAHLWEVINRSMHIFHMIMGGTRREDDERMVSFAEVIRSKEGLPPPSSGEAPAEIHPSRDDFKSDRLKEGVQQVIYHHLPYYATELGAALHCKCGKKFKASKVEGKLVIAPRKWSNHIRIAIWKYMLKEYKYARHASQSPEE